MTYDNWKTREPDPVHEDATLTEVELLCDEIDRLTQDAETGEQWAHICELEAQLHEIAAAGHGCGEGCAGQRRDIGPGAPFIPGTRVYLRDICRFGERNGVVIGPGPDPRSVLVNWSGEFTAAVDVKWLAVDRGRS
jgi:hypothetical protein